MGKTIENKVVSLELDDSKFTSRVDGVLRNVDRLKSGMNFKQSTDGLDNVGKAAQDASKRMGGIADSVRNINVSIADSSTNAASATSNVGTAAKISSTNFSMLAGAASVALGNIASKALMAGSSVLSAFTLRPIMDGFREYENQLNAVQTIQANTFSKGETIATINAALDELNKYADKTIYSFGEMTKNIGMFTSAGVGLKESVTAIKGLSNVAAMSGASSTQAATAMYQLSQALSTGVVKLQDWNSIVNAGMGGEQFQESLKRTARVYGVNVDQMISKTGSFRNSLAEGWLTSEIMIQTLAQYTGDLSKEQLLNAGYTAEQADEIMRLAETANDAATKVKTFGQLMETVGESLGSGWASIFRTIFGDFERARTMWTAVSDVINGGIGAFFDALQGILDRWDQLGGWEEWWYGLGELWTAIAKPLKAIGEGFFSAFNGDAGKALYDFSYYFRHSISQWLTMSDDFATNLGKIFKMVGQFVSPALNALIAVASAIAQIGVAAFKIGTILAGIFIKPIILIAAKVGDIVSVFSDWFGQMLGGIGILGGLAKVLDWIVDKFQRLADWMYAVANVTITPIFDGLKVVIEAVLKPLGEFINTIKTAASNVFKPFGDAVSNVFSSIFGFAAGASGPFEKIKNVFGGFGSSFLENMTKLADAIGPKWSEKVKAFSDSILPISESIGKHLGGAVESAGKGLKKFWDDVSPKAAEAWTIAIKQMKSSISEVGKAFSRVGDVISKTFTPQIEAVKQFGKVLSDTFANVGDRFTDNTFMSSIVDGFKNMMDSFGPFGVLINGVINLFKKLGDLTGTIFGGFSRSADNASEGLSRFNDAASGMVNTLGAVGAFVYSAAMGIVGFCASAVESIANLIDWLTKGVGSIKQFASESQAFGSFKKNISDAFANAGQMIKTFWSDLGDSLKNLSISDLLSGVLLGGGLGMGFKTLQNLLGGFQSITDSASGLIDKISSVFGELKNSLSALTEAIKAKSLRDIAISIAILAGSLFVLAMIPAAKLIQGAVAIGVLAKILTTAMNSLSSLKVGTKQLGTIFGSLLMLSGALLTLSVATAILGSMDTKTLAQGLIAIGLMVEGMSRVAKKLASDEKQMISGTASLIAMAFAINMLIVPIAALGALPTGVIIQGLVAVGLLMGGISAFILVLNKSSASLTQMLGISVMLLQFANSMAVLAAVVAALGSIPTGVLIQGILGLAGVVAIMAVAVTTIPPTAISGAFSLLIMAGAMLVATKAIEEIGRIPWGELLNATLKMGAVIAGLIVAANFAQGSVVGVAAILLLAVAVRVLASAIEVIGNLDASKIGIAMLAIAGGLLIFIGAAALAQMVIPGLIALTAAIAALGIIAFGIISGITLLVMTFTAFIVAISLAGPAIGAGITAIASGIAAGAAIIAAASPAIEAALIGVANAVRNAAPALGEALVALVKAFGPVVVEIIKVLGDGIRQIAAEVITLINEQGPGMISALVGFLVNLLATLAENMPAILENLFSILDSILTALDEYLPKLGEHLISWVSSIFVFLEALIPQCVAFVITLVTNIVNTLADNLGPMIQAGVNLISAWLVGMASAAGQIIDAAFNALITFINAFSDAIDQRGPELKAAVWKLVNSIANFLFGDIASIAGSIGSRAASIGGNIIDGIKNGINNAKHIVLNLMRNLAYGCLDTVKSFLGIHSPSRKFAEVAKFMMLGMSKGLSDNEDMLYSDLRDISKSILDSIDSNMEYSPVIKPVVDTSEIQSLDNIDLNRIGASITDTPVQNGSQIQTELRALREDLKSVKTPTVFNQYNNSPKALDLYELYRQTERQLERMERL